jgi:predicted nucleic-acid-binding Zn-ribbon protein
MVRMWVSIKRNINFLGGAEAGERQVKVLERNEKSFILISCDECG